MDIREHLIKAKNGDYHSKEIIIEQFTPLLKATIKKVFINSYTYDDLIQEGKIFILNAIDKFDISKTDKEFSMYLFYTVRNNYNYLCRRNIRYNSDVSLNKVNPNSEEDYLDAISDNTSIEDTLIFKELISKLNKKILLLSGEEQDLIYNLYFKNPREKLSSYCIKKNIKYSKGSRLKKSILEKLT